MCLLMYDHGNQGIQLYGYRLHGEQSLVNEGVRRASPSAVAIARNFGRVPGTSAMLWAPGRTWDRATRRRASCGEYTATVQHCKRVSCNP